MLELGTKVLYRNIFETLFLYVYQNTCEYKEKLSNQVKLTHIVHLKRFSGGT